MGAENSTEIDESVHPQTLEARTIEAVAKFIKESDIRRIVVMTGAGISTSAGIPDFRSPETGLYANLARLNLPYAEAVFDISYFRENPLPFYALAHELYPGRYRPTITHAFIKLLYDKGRLLKLFTQNIDCLEREAGVPGEAIVEAHGSFATQRCIECKRPYPDDKMKRIIKERQVPRCINPECNGLVKPDIVFFGEALPEAFHMNRTLPATADLVIIMGTSLTVQPFASLPAFVSEGTPRVLINLERVGGLGSRPDDVLLLKDCDEGVRIFADALGWRDELEALWEATDPEKGRQKEKDEQKAGEAEPPKTKDDKIKEEVDKLTEEIEKTLTLESDRQKLVLEELSKDTSSTRDEIEAEREAQPEPDLDRWMLDKSARDLGITEVVGDDDDDDEKTKTKTVEESGETTTTNANVKDEDEEDRGLEHVFPHIGRRASL